MDTTPTTKLAQSTSGEAKKYIVATGKSGDDVLPIEKPTTPFTRPQGTSGATVLPDVDGVTMVSRGRGRGQRRALGRVTSEVRGEARGERGVKEVGKEGDRPKDMGRELCWKMRVRIGSEAKKFKHSYDGARSLWKGSAASHTSLSQICHE